MTQELKEKLKNLEGENIKYKKQYYKVLEFKEVNSLIVMITNRETFNFIGDEIDEFLDEVEIHEGVVSYPKYKSEIQAVMIPEKNNGNAVDLEIFKPTESQNAIKTALIYMLDKVKENKEYILQAKATVDIANALVNMEKSQIQMINTARKLSRR